MAETAAGFLEPRLGGTCNGCGACTTACPGAHLPTGLLDGCGDPFRGPVLNAYLARACDQRLFKNGQSGGAVTGLIAHLLSTGQCDGALVTGPIGSDGRPKPLVATTLEEMHSAQGSKYCPVALNVLLRSERFQKLARPVIVGLACHVHGIRSLQRIPRSPIARAPLVLGLICSGVYSFHKIEHLRRAAGVAASDDFLGLRYKDKESYGWPGDVSVYSRSRGKIRVSQRVRNLGKTAFRPPRCYLCFDQMNVLSDISFGDPWGIRWDRDGWTVVLTRSEAGQSAVDGAVAAHAMTVERIEPESVFAGQTVDSRQRPEWTSATAAWQKMRRVAPSFGFSTSFDTRGDARCLSVRRTLTYSIAFSTSATRTAAIQMAQWRVRRSALSRILMLPIKSLRLVMRRLAHFFRSSR